MVNAQLGVSCSSVTQNCPDKFGCYTCPDFVIKRYDTQPPFRVAVDDCDGALDLTSTTLVLEANIWAKGKLKANILATDTYFALADGIGFEQINLNDIIIIDRVRSPEQMLVTGFDEGNKLVRVERGYNNTPVSAWKKGSCLRIMRTINSPGTIELVYNNVLQVDGSTQNTLTASYLVYTFSIQDTCLPGCYNLEFKLINMTGSVSLTAFDTLSTTTVPTFTTTSSECILSSGVSWIRRFPSDREGFLIQVVDTPTAE